MKKIIILLLIAMFVYSCSTQKEQTKKPYVVMLSMDAFRWDYPEMYKTPNLDSIEKYGVRAKSLKPCFPTKTFPNHYSMATGLYPDHHGIVQNSFYAPDLNLYYSIGNRGAVENPAFYNGEPIWATAKKQGMISASYFWVGSETTSKELRPNYWKRYNQDLPFEQRIDSVIAWLQLAEEKRPHLILWYMHEPDGIGHKFGPYSDSTAKVVNYLDSLVGVFIKKINKLPIANDINLIFTADHGMGSISDERKVVLSKILPKEWINEVQGSNPVYLLDMKKQYEDTAFQILSRIEHIKVWKSNEMPDRFHYGKNPRTLDLIVAADSAWTLNYSTRKYRGSGTHGYDNKNTDMHAIFYAIGPSFKTNYNQPSFNNIDLYILIAHILGLNPAKNDGNFEHIKGMLKDSLK